jgi:type I restriction enzyme S subunit
MSRTPLNAFCALTMGQSPDSESYNIEHNGFPFYQGNADFGRIHPMVRVWCSEPKKLAKAGDILISVRAPIGALNIADCDCCIGRGLAAITPDATCADTMFLFYALYASAAELQRRGTGSTFKAISKNALSNLLLPSYCLEEQKEISAVLQQVDHLISLRQRQAEKLDELVKARFVEMFGDPVRNTKHWEKASLLALGSCKNGMSFHANESGIKLRCLGVGDFKNLSYIDDVEQLPFVSLAEKPSANCFLHDGDIVFVRSNGNKALVGRCLLVYPRDTPTIYSGFCIRYRLLTEKVDPIYALHVLKADGIRQKMSGRGANIQNLNQKILAAIEMPIPLLPLQNAFATFVHEVDREKERIQRSAALLETLKRSLMQQYFG